MIKYKQSLSVDLKNFLNISAIQVNLWIYEQRKKRQDFPKILKIAIRLRYRLQRCLKISFRAYSLMMNSITRSLNIVAILTKIKDRKQTFYWQKFVFDLCCLSKLQLCLSFWWYCSLQKSCRHFLSIFTKLINNSVMKIKNNFLVLLLHFFKFSSSDI